jgi:hypothetical protein
MIGPFGLPAPLRYNPSNWGTVVANYGDIGLQFVLPLLRSVIIIRDYMTETLFEVMIRMAPWWRHWEMA